MTLSGQALTGEAPFHPGEYPECIPGRSQEKSFAVPLSLTRLYPFIPVTIKNFLRKCP